LPQVFIAIAVILGDGLYNFIKVTIISGRALYVHYQNRDQLPIAASGTHFFISLTIAITELSMTRQLIKDSS
jgi:hypothetical protein